MYKIMITGHRPSKIGGYDFDNPIRIKIRDKIKNILLEHKKIHKEIVCISGMAIGVDQDFCSVCLDLKIPYIAYVPFNGQENIWPTPAKNFYKELLNKAKAIKTVSKGGYSPKKMQIRNEAMANDCDMAIAIFDGTNGGTCNCVNYLKKIKKAIIVIDPNKL